MSNYEATRYDFDGANLQDIEGVNTGLIIPWGNASPPSGFLECNGAAVSRTTYAALFAVVGTVYGVGDGSTTFNLPDLQDRLVQSRTPLTNIATNAGSSTVSVTGNIAANLGTTALNAPLFPTHAHNRQGAHPSFRYLFNPNQVAPQSRGSNYTGTSNAGGGGSHNHNASLNFVGDTMDPQQASLVLMYVIKT